MHASRLTGFSLLLLATVAAGCIERKVTINTNPTGATVWLNDQEVGKTPVTVPFTWYGDYDVVCRAPQHETLRTHVRINTPWYELPGLDLFTESFTPFTVRDHRAYHFDLAPEHPPTQTELLGRAAEFRERALFKAD